MIKINNFKNIILNVSDNIYHMHIRQKKLMVKLRFVLKCGPMIEYLPHVHKKKKFSGIYNNQLMNTLSQKKKKN